MKLNLHTLIGFFLPGRHKRIHLFRLHCFRLIATKHALLPTASMKIIQQFYLYRFVLKSHILACMGICAVSHMSVTR